MEFHIPYAISVLWRRRAVARYGFSRDRRDESAPVGASRFAAASHLPDQSRSVARASHYRTQCRKFLVKRFLVRLAAGVLRKSEQTKALKNKRICRIMEDMVGANAVKEVNSTADGIYYELDGEGDADSSTTPSHNVDHHRDPRVDPTRQVRTTRKCLVHPMARIKAQRSTVTVPRGGIDPFRGYVHVEPRRAAS
ncbi:hypothetical protein DMN91_003483 [Ooceraea biroi]|uniref:Uncharacterized protein n=1 Tax=Ooceraea biroi TaxID=2015173 RepID=A0A3L8DS71_OOCBI|nr:hypothetical protein DMN91_003483 [Ooceraea biroi]